MNTLKFFVVIAMLMTLNITLSATPETENVVAEEETYFVNKEDTSYTVGSSPPENEEPTTSLRGVSRFLAQKKRLRATMTCDKYPRVCHTKGSQGQDCCKKKCVNVMTDRLNCGSCGHKCKYAEICCKGECVNPRSNKRHCGGCNNRCKKGNVCVYGMCSYA